MKQQAALEAGMKLELVKLPGIGRWTAEMFMMFHLLRPDVLAVDDLGLIKGFKMAYKGRWKTDGDLKVWQKRLRKVSKGVAFKSSTIKSAS